MPTGSNGLSSTTGLRTSVFGTASAGSGAGEPRLGVAGRRCRGGSTERAVASAVAAPRRVWFWILLQAGIADRAHGRHRRQGHRPRPFVLAWLEI